MLGDRYERLGLAVARVVHMYPGDSEGRYLDIRYLGTNNAYYRWFVENKGKPGGLEKHAYHHFCRRHASRCSRSIGREDVVHIQKWAPISRATASDILVEWGLDPLGPDRAPPERQRAPEAGYGATPKGKASDKRQTAVAAVPAPVEDEHFEEEEGEAEVASARRPSLKRERRTSVKVKPEATALDTMLDEGLGEDGSHNSNQMQRSWLS